MNTNNKRGFLLRAVQAKANKFNQEKKNESGFCSVDKSILNKMKPV